jgi:hypothetical protein
VSVVVLDVGSDPTFIPVFASAEAVATSSGADGVVLTPRRDGPAEIRILTRRRR